MVIDQNATDPAFTEGRLPADDVLQSTIDWSRRQMSLNGHRPWKLISARRKFSKILIEIEEQRPDGPVRLILKIAEEDRARITFQALRELWDAGFRPPSQYTVVEPYAYLEEKRIVIQERAPGVELVRMVEANDPECLTGFEHSANWLARLHASGVHCEPWHERTWVLDKWATELSVTASDHAGRFVRVAEKASRAIAGIHEDMVPCHGDFHLMNIFVAPTGRITGIDIDKFGCRPRAEEVGYCLAQTASICFHRLKSFEASRTYRDLILERYESESGVAPDRAAMGAFMAATFIKNLHYDLVSYRSGRTHIVDSWLTAAEHCLEGDIASL